MRFIVIYHSLLLHLSCLFSHPTTTTFLLCSLTNLDPLFPHYPTGEITTLARFWQLRDVRSLFPHTFPVVADADCYSRMSM